jgi:hypothetical protein
MILKRQEKDNIIKALYDSSNVLASTYDTSSNDLTLIFKSGTQYKYNGVSKSDYMRFEIAESQGKVFNTHIKKYSFEKLENIDASRILLEADKLKVDEETALLEGKKIEVLNRLKYVLHVEEGLAVNKTQEAQDLFIESLKKLQTQISDYLNDAVKL